MAAITEEVSITLVTAFLLHLVKCADGLNTCSLCLSGDGKKIK